MNAIVVYHSKTGTTRSVATRVAASIGCGSDAIKAPDQGTGIFGMLSAGIGLVTGQHGAINIAHDPAAHDLVIVGTPVWAGKCAGPVVEYLRKHKNTFKNLAFFATSGMSGGSGAFSEMERVAGKAPVAVLHVLAAEVAGGGASSKIERFTSKVKDAFAGKV